MSASSSAEEYDAMPYEGHPDPMIHPDRLAAVAWLHGVEAAPLEQARILEIGCATGAHLIPMACELPTASLAGFDYAARQIALARAAAAAVNLTNIEFAVRDIRADHQDLGEFDYILAHGVFSWVARDVQDGVLEICRRHLAPTGVALVDYNVLPGWHLRAFLRDLMSYHRDAAPLRAGPDGASGLAAVTQATLDSLDFVAGHLFAPASAFGQSIGHLQRWVGQQAKNYLAHELSGGQPLSFREFAARARAGRLEILGDAEITQVIPAPFVDALNRKLEEVAGGDYVRREQYLDFLRGRDFRRTLLVHDHVQVDRQVRVPAMHRLRFTTVARRETMPPGTVGAPLGTAGSPGRGGGAVYRCPDGAALGTVNGSVIGALDALCKAGPTGLTFDVLCECGGIDVGATAARGCANFTESLLEAAASGVIQLHAHSPRVVGQVSARPVANALARAAAGAGQHVVTSMLHRDWRIDELERRLICLLDGTRERRELAARLGEPMAAGGVMGDTAGAGIGSGSDSGARVEAQVSSSLDWFARVGILTG